MIKEEGSDDVSASGTVMENVSEDKQQPAAADGDAVKVRTLQHHCMSQKKTGPDKRCAFLQILFWLMYLNNLNATTFSYHLPNMQVHLMR